jgi:hypothetical protein
MVEYDAIINKKNAGAIPAVRRRLPELEARP